MLEPVAYLGLDCSSPYLALALYGDGVQERFAEPVERNHARRITTTLDDLMARAELTPHDLQGVTVGFGPGSYTGLRVAIAFAQGLTQSLALPLRGESSLLAMAATALDEHTPHGIVALDARRGNVYAGTFRWREGRLEQEGNIVKTPREPLQQGLLPYFENVAPDALYLARCAERGANTLTPLYL